jgi:hypothetical protein
MNKNNLGKISAIVSATLVALLVIYVIFLNNFVKNIDLIVLRGNNSLSEMDELYKVKYYKEQVIHMNVYLKMLYLITIGSFLLTFLKFNQREKWLWWLVSLSLLVICVFNNSFEFTAFLFLWFLWSNKNSFYANRDNFDGVNFETKNTEG